MNAQDLSFVYFGGEPLGVPVLEELEKVGLLPKLIVCNPDRPVGRKQVLTAPLVKQWALERNIEVLQVESFKEKEHLVALTEKTWDLFVVVAYNKILPKWIIDLPTHKTINVHPSLLPLLRGASPIRSAILEDMRTTGVSIMLMDEKMDHGPLLSQETVTIEEAQWPISGIELDALLAKMGGTLLAQTIPQYIAGTISAQEQDHATATYCGRLDRSMGELSLDPYSLPTGEEAYACLLKIRAFAGYPGTFFMHNGKRIKIVDATIENNQLSITSVIPEGKKEMTFQQFIESATSL